MESIGETDAELLWADVVDTLEQAELPAATIAMLRSCEATSLEDGVLTVRCSSRFVQRTIGRVQAQLDETATSVAFEDTWKLRSRALRTARAGRRGRR